MATIKLDGNWWSINDIESFINSDAPIELDESLKSKVLACRSYLDKEIDGSEAVYGINTGFGSLCDTSIEQTQLEQLQLNLVRSHACGTGKHVPKPIVKLMVLLKLRGLSYGHSGVTLTTIERLIDLYNHNLLPEIYDQGSLGASGDLAPLSHLALSLIGEGNIWKEGNLVPASKIYQNMNWQALNLQSKEGLALLNGTQFMSAYGTHCIMRSERLLKWADLIAAMSMEGFDCRPEPFTPEVHAVRGHQGQINTAKNIKSILDESTLFYSTKQYVQDPYSFRCVPQVHGASKDALEYCKQVFEREINSVTDNPTIFPEQDMIISAGNFHGQPLAISMDFLAIAMAEIGSISERRTYKLISGTRGLPAFLVANPGINSGFMIPQYTAASIVSQNKQLCTPASVDTIDSSNGQEDHVSMGANSATKLLRIVENVETILAIELMNAAQAIEFRDTEKSSPIIKNLLKAYRKTVKFAESDRVFHNDIQASLSFLRSYPLNERY